MSNISRVCIFCHAPADMLCQRCRDPYCSPKCQQTDWPHHKLMCFPMPLLVKATQDAGQQAESESMPRKLENNISLNSSSSHATFQKLRVPNSNSNVDMKNENSQPTAVGMRNLASSVNNRLNPGFQSNGSRNGNAQVEKSAVNDKADLSNFRKPAYPKSFQIDAASIRRPGTTIQITPKPIAIEAIPDPVKIVELPKPEPVKTEPPKKPEPVKIEPPKPVPIEIQPPKPLEPVVTEEKKTAIEVQKTTKPNIVETEPQLVVNVPKTEKWMIPLPIPENEFVPVIVQYISPDNTVWVSAMSNEAASNKLLREINKSKSTALTAKPHEIKVNGLFSVPFEDIHYRGIVLEPVSREGTVNVRLVDYGNDIILPIGELKLPIPAMTELNAYAFPIKFKTPRQVDIGNEFKIKAETIKDNVMTVIIEGDVTALTMKDIETVPIPMDSTQKLFCLDFSNIGQGYISACIYDQKAIASVEEVGVKVTEYCKRTKDEYCPQVGELCLSLFEDGQWYRAVTLKVVDEKTFEIMFIDYGNITTVNSSSIRKMAHEFLHCCLQNKCNIKGFPKKPTKMEMQDQALFFNDNQIFKVKTVEIDNNGEYVIDPAI